MAVDSRPVKRTIEIEEATNLYFIHPISRALVAVFQKFGLHPNLVSLGGIGFGALAAWAYFQYSHWEMALAGFLFMIGWHVMDGADGQLARLTGKTSEVGKVLDGVVDHVTFALVYVSLTIASAAIWGNWVWWLTAAAGISHAVQASTYEFQRQSYNYWVFGNKSDQPVRPSEYRRSMKGVSGIKRLFAWVQLGYLYVQYRLAGINNELIGSLLELKDGPHAVEMREAYRSTNLRAVKRWSVLSSNYRTIAIFVACLASNPLLFFVFEILFLNAALLALQVMQTRRNRALLSWAKNGSVSESRFLAAA